VVEQSAPADGPGGDTGPVIVLVHGSLDRGATFRRVVRRLDGRRVLTYDRRGYQGSRRAGAADLEGHAEDLLALIEAADIGDGGAVAVGHSFGGDVVLTAAAMRPEAFTAVAAYEPPMPWLGFRRPPGQAAGPPDADPEDEVERFFRRMTGDEAWARLSAAGRAERLADGPALVADLRQLQRPTAPFDVTALVVPTTFGAGGPASAPHHRQAATWLTEHVRGAELIEIPAAGHGAHLSHPDAFAAFVIRAAARGTREGSAPLGRDGGR